MTDPPADPSAAPPAENPAKDAGEEAAQTRVDADPGEASPGFASAASGVAARLLPRLRTCIPSLVGGMSDDELRAATERGIEHAGRLGFSRPDEVFKLVCVRFILGEGFDRDPALPWVSRLLESPASPGQKLSLLFATMRVIGTARHV